jgi:hypothetical protein
MFLLSDNRLKNELPVRLKSRTVIPLGKTVGEPYRGKPDVRFDEGDLRRSAGASY